MPQETTLRPLELLWLGRRPYAEVLALQRQRQAALIAKQVTDCLIVCEHEPTVTVGRSGAMQNIRSSLEQLKAGGVSFHEVERGGDVTFHGPGQIVLYPIIDLNHHRRDVSWYLRSLEEVGIRALAKVGVHGFRYPGRTGIWTAIPEHVIESTGGSSPARKIASIGVRLSRWCTLHGMALNVADCRTGFSLINPCGFTDIEMTSVAQETGSEPEIESVGELLGAEFCSYFGYQAPCFDGQRHCHKTVSQRMA